MNVIYIWLLYSAASSMFMSEVCALEIFHDGGERICLRRCILWQYNSCKVLSFVALKESHVRLNIRLLIQVRPSLVNKNFDEVKVSALSDKVEVSVLFKRVNVHVPF